MHESIDSPQIEIGGRPRRWRRLLWLLLLPVAAALLLWWFSTRAATYRLADSFRITDIILVPAETGFLVRDGARFTLHDWNGGRKWSVTLLQSEPDDRPGRRLEQGAACALSPDGHFFAAATVLDRAIRVQTWRDGRGAGDCMIGIADPRSRLLLLKVLDNGRVFLWFPAPGAPLATAAMPAYVIEGNYLAGKGTFPPQTILAPDGSAIASLKESAFDYAEVAVDAGTISLRNGYTGADSLGGMGLTAGFVFDSAMFAAGAVLAENGAVYGPAGRQSPPGDLRHQGMAPGGRYTLQYTAAGGRAYSPVTGDAWAFPVTDRLLGGDATPDGQYALAWCASRPNEQLREFLRGNPFMTRFIGDGSADYMVLYQRPGRRVAIWRSQFRRSPESRDIIEQWWFPSPDGRTLAMTIRTANSLRCFVFRHSR